MIIIDSSLLFWAITLHVCTGWPKKVSHYQFIKNCVKSY